MIFSVGFSYFVAIMTAGIASVALYRDPRFFVQRVFIIGMVLFAVEAGLSGLGYQAQSLERFLFWQRLQLVTASVLPVFWLLFSVSFARANYLEQILKWKWILLLSVVLPLSMVTIFNNAFFTVRPVLTEASTLFMHIGWSGYVWHLFWITISLLILMNLERTFRHTTGRMRWQSKFMFLGIGSIFGVHLFTDSQTILFNGVNTGLLTVNLGALLVANLLSLQSFFRGRPLNVSVRLSHQFLYNSFTLLIVGIYFISVGVIAWFSVRFDWVRNIHIIIFLIFLAFIGLAIVLLSDRLRMKRKRFISRHFKRPQYDYQKIWEDFTKRTTSVTQTGELCNIIVKMVSDTMEILSVSIWLVDEKQEMLSFGGSTAFTVAQAEELKFFGQGGADLIQAMINQTLLVDLKGRKDDWVEDLKRTYGLESKEFRMRYCIPLHAAGRLIGVMTLSEKVFYEPVTFEESELIKNIADQAAAILMNLRLSERLRETKELEAFQSMSAFFLHDLKHLASKLSLVTQNFSVHMDNPEFRKDALNAISQSVSKVNAMSGRLSLLSQKLNLAYNKTDLNHLVASTVSVAKEYVMTPISQKLDQVAPIYVDKEQIHKVLENLLMNAYDATGENGQIAVATHSGDKWAEISVSDNGSGISKEFMEKNLFRPFQTTKKQGMGIGLYHCKTIVEAHGGKIEAISEEGKGTTFRIFLPLMR